MTEFVLHIGRHKSGTTSLQRFLHANRLVLQREGLVYPETPAGAFAHHEIAEVFARRIRKASRELNTDESRTVARITDVAASSGKKVLLSSEGFQNADPAVVAQYFPPGKTQVIVYVREQADYVLSSYQQKVHAHNHFLRLDTSFQQSVVDYDKFLSGWEKAFGREHIVVRAYERKLLKDGDIIADFLELLGLDQVMDLAFDNEDQNPSIGGQLLEFKRFLNACGTDSINAGRLYGVLSRLASRDPAYRARPHMAQAIATNIRGSVRVSNQRVFERYFEGRDVFNYRSTESVDGPQNCDANAVVEVLRQIGNEDPVVSRQIVSRISASLGFASPTSKVDELVSPLLQTDLNAFLATAEAKTVEESLPADPKSNVGRAETIRLTPPASAAQYYAYRNQSKPSPILTTVLLKDAYLSVDGKIPGHKHFFIFDSNRKLVEKFSHGSDPFINQEVVEMASSPVAFIDDRRNAFNVCHLLLDKLPRISHFSDADAPIYLLITESAYTREVFSMLQKPVTFALARPNQRITFRVKDLLLTSGSFGDFRHPAQHFNRKTVDALDFFRSELRRGAKSSRIWSAKPIYVSRSKSRFRHIVNEHDVRQLLEEMGFETLQLEDLSLSDQIAAFSTSTGVVGLHGAGLTNGMFLPRGSFVGEILPPLCATGAYWEMSYAFGLRYDAFIARDPDGVDPDYSTWKHDGSMNHRDVVVDIERLSPFIQKLMMR